MKKIYVLVVLLAFAVAACKDDDNGIEGNDPAVVTEEFDEAFARELFNRGYITDPEDIAKIKEEVAGITELDVSDVQNNGGLTSLKGIEYFSSLEVLDCSDNNLTTLDVSGCTALTELSCYNNSLTTLDVSHNTALRKLWCYNNNLTTLDVSGCTALTELYCGGNNLSTLDVSANTALDYLFCYNNSLTTLDVSHNTALRKLWCYNNNLTTLDVSNNTALKHMLCFYNPGSGGVFTVVSWFDDTTVPSENFTTGNWYYKDNHVTIHYQKK